MSFSNQINFPISIRTLHATSCLSVSRSSACNFCLKHFFENVFLTSYFDASFKMEDPVSGIILFKFKFHLSI